MKNYVFISRDENPSETQKALIAEAVANFNRSIFDAEDAVEDEIFYDADFTCIGYEGSGYADEENTGKGSESPALAQLFGTITAILEN